MQKRDLRRENRQRMQIGAGLLLVVLAIVGTFSFIKSPTVAAGTAHTELATTEDFSIK